MIFKYEHFQTLKKIASIFPQMILLTSVRNFVVLSLPKMQF